MPVAATHAESHLDPGVGVPPGVGAKEDEMPCKLGPPLPPDDPLFQRWTVFIPAPKPITSGTSEEAKSEEVREKPKRTKRSRPRRKERG